MPSVQTISHMCSHLQNVSKARLAITSVPNNKFNLNLALALHRSGFLSHVYRAGPKPPTLEQMITEEPVLSLATPISKPSRLMTVNIAQLGKLTRGLSAQLKGGVVPGLNLGECLYVATSQGVLESREALARKVGGLLLCARIECRVVFQEICSCVYIGS